MSLFSVFDISSSAMHAQSARLNAVASNLANAESVTSSNGQPYRAKQVVFEVAKVGESAMLNFIGSVPPVEKVIAIADCHLHHYGKAFKVGRKVGHANLRCADMATLQAQILKVEALIDEA